jgi:hypothetical protein
VSSGRRGAGARHGPRVAFRPSPEFSETPGWHRSFSYSYLCMCCQHLESSAALYARLIAGVPLGVTWRNSGPRGEQDIRRPRRADPGLIWGGGARTDVIAPPPGELFSETNDNSVAILLTYGTARVLLVGDAETREEECISRTARTRGFKRSSGFETTKQSELRFRALLTGSDARVLDAKIEHSCPDSNQKVRPSGIRATSFGITSTDTHVAGFRAAIVTEPP